jgi:hypothetical protein
MAFDGCDCRAYSVVQLNIGPAKSDNVSSKVAGA